MSYLTKDERDTLYAIRNGILLSKWDPTPAMKTHLANLLHKVLLEDERREDLMTEDEHEALRLSGELAVLGFKIIRSGGGRSVDQDAVEWATRIHSVQHMIAGQAAARAFPDKYRPLGSVIEP